MSEFELFSDESHKITKQNNKKRFVVLANYIYIENYYIIQPSLKCWDTAWCHVQYPGKPEYQIVILVSPFFSLAQLHAQCYSYRGIQKWLYNLIEINGYITESFM
jgi:hypothetical protein